MDLMEVVGLMLGARPRAVTADYTDDDVTGTSCTGRIVVIDDGKTWLDDRDDGIRYMSGPRGYESKVKNGPTERSDRPGGWTGGRHPGAMLLPRRAYLWSTSHQWRLADPVQVSGTTAEVPLVSQQPTGYTGRIRVDLRHGYILDFETIHGQTTLTGIRDGISGPDLAVLQKVR